MVFFSFFFLSLSLSPHHFCPWSSLTRTVVEPPSLSDHFSSSVFCQQTRVFDPQRTYILHIYTLTLSLLYLHQLRRSPLGACFSLSLSLSRLFTSLSLSSVHVSLSLISSRLSLSLICSYISQSLIRVGEHTTHTHQVQRLVPKFERHFWFRRRHKRLCQSRNGQSGEWVYAKLSGR